MVSSCPTVCTVHEHCTLDALHLVITKNGVLFTEQWIWWDLKSLSRLIVKSSQNEMVVELSMQCCGKLLSDSFEIY